jgi:maltose alpha-D-glucosyltransferase/alpha-amylase
MAENLAIPGRMSVRAPMQWSEEPNGGFSTAPPEHLRRPVVEGRRWGPKAVNAARQRREGDSLLAWMERLIRRRRETPEIAFGGWSLVKVPDAAVFGLRYDWEGRTVLVLHNLGPKPCKASCRLDHTAGWEGLIDLVGRGAFAIAKDGTLTVELEGYGCRWLRVRQPGVPPI